MRPRSSLDPKKSLLFNHSYVMDLMSPFGSMSSLDTEKYSLRAGKPGKSGNFVSIDLINSTTNNLVAKNFQKFGTNDKIFHLFILFISL